MYITSNLPPQPTTAALRIGGAAALALVAMLGLSALVGPTATDQGLRADTGRPDVMQSQSARQSPGLTVAGKLRR